MQRRRAMRIVDAIRRHELLAYFGLTFAISWSAELGVLLPTVGFPASAEAFSTQSSVFAASIGALLLGPPIASLLTSAVAGAKALVWNSLWPLSLAVIATVMATARSARAGSRGQAPTGTRVAFER